MHLDTIKFLFHPTEAQLNIPSKMLKFTLKSSPICFGLNKHDNGSLPFVLC